MNQFFVDPASIEGNKIFIRGNDVNHIRNVLRMQPGEEIAVKTGEDDKEYRCEIEEIREEEILLNLRFVKEAGVELPSKIYLFQGLPKGDKMELIIQKAIELGAYQIIPVAMKRSVVKLDEKKAKLKISRWQSISEAAAKQSKRAIIPLVHSLMTFEEALNYAKEREIKLLPYEMAEGMEQTREHIEAIQPGQDIAIFIGPEGGFDEKEIAQAELQGIIPITLGRRILRTETAGLTILSFIMYHLEGKNID